MKDVPAWVRPHLPPGERVLWWCRPSPVAALPIAASALAGGAYLVLGARLGFDEPGLLSGAPALVLAVLALAFEFLRRLARLLFTLFVVTEERVHLVTTFLEADVKSIPLSRVSHVSVRRGAAGWLLGFWNARIGVHGEEGALVVPAVREGERLLQEVSDGQRRGADAAWLLRGD